MAYLRKITETCRQPGCTSRASYQLMGWPGATLGYYCKRHAGPALAHLDKIEAGYTSPARSFDVT